MDKSQTKISRRSFLKGAAAGAVLLAGPGIPFIAKKAIAADPLPIKVAVVDALSGAYSRNGNLVVQNSKGMMDLINVKGGIKSLGGAKLVAVVGDCQEQGRGGRKRYGASL